MNKTKGEAVTDQKSSRLFFLLGGFFVANALIAEFIGVKIFALEDSLGMSSWFGEADLNFSAGVILWPIVFIMTDIINEYYGVRGVKFLSYLTVGLISYAFLAAFSAIHLSPASWWVDDFQAGGVPDAQAAYATIFGQGMWIIVGSIVAFLVGQLIDAVVFSKIKVLTGEKAIWIRATASTLVSQFIDSFVVIYIAFVLGSNWTMDQFFSVSITNYIYKLSAAILLIPLLYVIHEMIDRYLGKEKAEELKQLAMDS